MFCKKDVLKNFLKFTGKHLCQSLFFNEVADLRPATLLKKRLWHSFFTLNFVKFLRTPFYKEYIQWLLLKIVCGFTDLQNSTFNSQHVGAELGTCSKVAISICYIAMSVSLKNPLLSSTSTNLLFMN